MATRVKDGDKLVFAVVFAVVVDDDEDGDDDTKDNRYNFPCSVKAKI